MISDETRRQDAPTDGSRTSWPFTFRIYSPNHVQVKLFNAAGVGAVIPSSQYSLELGSGNTRDGWAGGTITYPLSGSPASAGGTLRIERVLPFTQQNISLTPAAGWDPKAIEREFDLGVMRDQQLKEGSAAGSVAVPLGYEEGGVTLPSPGAGQFIKWNDTGTGLEVGISSFTRDAYSFESIAAIEAATLTPGPNQILLGGRFTYQRAATGQFQSLDGQWWAPALPLCASQFGAVEYGDPAENRLAIQAMFDYAATLADTDINPGTGRGVTMFIDASYEIDDTVTIPSGCRGLNLVFTGELSASSTFPTTSGKYMLVWTAGHANIASARILGNNIAWGGMQVSGGRISVDFPGINGCTGVHLQLTGSNGAMEIRHPNIFQLANNSTGFDDDASFTAVGIQIDTGDCAIIGGTVRYTAINIEITSNATGCDIRGVHPFNGRGGNARINAKDIVIRAGATGRLYDCYLDNGQIDVYGAMLMHDCWVRIAADASDFTNDGIINLYADASNGPNRVIINRLWSNAGDVSNLGWNLIRFRSFEGNVWPGDYTAAHAVTQGFVNKLYNIRREEVTVDLTANSDFGETIASPRGDTAKRWYPGAWAGEVPSRYIREADGTIEYRCRGLRISSSTTNPTLYLGTGGVKQYSASGAVSIINGSSNGWEIIVGAGSLVPTNDDAQNLGRSDRRINSIWATDDTINTSDGREKKWLGGITDNEVNLGLAVAKEIGKFKWLNAIAAKGEEVAREHFGITVQRYVELAREHGVDPFRAGIACRDVWEAYTNNEGHEVEAGERLSLRKTELLALIVGAIARSL